MNDLETGELPRLRVLPSPSNALCDTLLNEQTHVCTQVPRDPYTHVHTPPHPHSPSGAREGPVSGLGRRGGSGQSGWQPVTIPSPSLGTCIKLVKGEGRHLFELHSLLSTSAQLAVTRFSALYQGQVWSPCHARLVCPHHCPRSPQGTARMERAGLSVPHEGPGPKWTYSPLPRQARVVARVGWGMAGAAAGSLSLLVGRVTAEWEGGQRSWQGGRTRGGAWVQAAPCSEPGPGPSTTLLEALLGCTTALTLRENISFGTFLPEGAMGVG